MKGIVELGDTAKTKGRSSRSVLGIISGLSVSYQSIGMLGVLGEAWYSSSTRRT